MSWTYSTPKAVGFRGHMCTLSRTYQYPLQWPSIYSALFAVSLWCVGWNKVVKCCGLKNRKRILCLYTSRLQSFLDWVGHLVSSLCHLKSFPMCLSFWLHFKESTFFLRLSVRRMYCSCIEIYFVRKKNPPSFLLSHCAVRIKYCCSAHHACKASENRVCLFQLSCCESIEDRNRP